jgi:hypothetical protein
MSYRYSYENTSNEAKALLPQGFKGEVFRLSDNWLTVVPVNENPVKIMEIGAYHGANVCSLVKTYAKNNNSEIHCVDPWLDYTNYSEYKDLQKTNYSIFLENITKLHTDDINKILQFIKYSPSMIDKSINLGFETYHKMFEMGESFGFELNSTQLYHWYNSRKKKEFQIENLYSAGYRALFVLTKNLFVLLHKGQSHLLSMR